jgi:predicted NAD-dependent protein-ADP-ribosyltransferase YbiA (DUF1768 family)
MLNLSRRLRKAITVKVDNVFAPLHNDSKYGFTVDSNEFKIFMHYYYFCLSTGDKQIQLNILKNNSINNARLALGSITCNRLSDYQNVVRHYNSQKLCTLLIAGIIENCRQNPIVKMLVQTSGDSQINFDCGNDSYLGIGPDGFGLNIMGVLVMIVRAKFKLKDSGLITYAEEKFAELNYRISGIELSKNGLSLSTITEEYEDDE